MKKLLSVLKNVSAALLLVGCFEGAGFCSEIPVRGIVEGFYGTPWSHNDRIDMIRFAAKHRMNAYIYAPKDDPYHREKWREPYPKEQEKNLSELIKVSKENGVRFIFAISPGLDLNYGEAGELDRLFMLNKLAIMYDLGVRDFAIFFDDIKDKNAEGQAEFLNFITKTFVKKHGDISPLITVPTEYFAQDIEKDGAITPYSKTFSTATDRSVLTLYTGRGVVCDSIPDIEYRAVCRIYGRKLGIWWNYPVTDYMEEKLALGPIEDLPVETEIPAIFFNPMKYAESSKIALATGAAYAKDPENYDADKAFKKALKDKYGKLANEMFLVASHSTHFENSWALVGREDGREFNKKVDLLFSHLPNNATEAEFKDIERELSALDKATVKLIAKLPKKDLKELQSHLIELNRMTNVSKDALTLLKTKAAGHNDDELLQKVRNGYEETLITEKKVKIADGSLKKFMKKVLDFCEN